MNDSLDLLTVDNSMELFEMLTRICKAGDVRSHVLINLLYDINVFDVTTLTAFVARFTALDDFTKRITQESTQRRGYFDFTTKKGGFLSTEAEDLYLSLSVSRPKPVLQPSSTSPEPSQAGTSAPASSPAVPVVESFVAG